jgi:hypothetical protein
MAVPVSIQMPVPAVAAALPSGQDIAAITPALSQKPKEHNGTEPMAPSFGALNFTAQFTQSGRNNTFPD